MSTAPIFQAFIFVVCSHDEILRFKQLAVHASSQGCELSAITDGEAWFTQVDVDNFDADISSQNGKQSVESNTNSKHFQQHYMD